VGGHDGDRCAVHPGRPAVDECPVCDRPRCSADAAAWPDGGCAACEGVRPQPPTRRAVTRETIVGAAAASHVAAVFAGAVSSQYVQVSLFGLLVPVGVGIGIGAAAEAGARGARGWAIRAVAVVYALIAVGAGFRFEPGGVGPLDLGEIKDVLGPYVCAAVGAWLWTVPPRKHKARTTSEAPDEPATA
jgi:hypothetical protein